MKDSTPSPLRRFFFRADFLGKMEKSGSVSTERGVYGMLAGYVTMKSYFLSHHVLWCVPPLASEESARNYRPGGGVICMLYGTYSSLHAIVHRVASGPCAFFWKSDFR